MRVAGMAICGTVVGLRADGMSYATRGESGLGDGMRSEGRRSGGGITFSETVECCIASSKRKLTT